MHGSTITLALLVALAARGAVGAAPLATAGDRVSLQFDSTPPQAAVAAVAALTGAHVSGEVHRRTPVTMQLDGTPVTIALQRILGDQTFSLTYGADGNLRTIALMGAAGPATPTAATPPLAPPAARIALEEALNHPVVVPPTMVPRFGTSQPTFRQLLDVSIRATDPDIRLLGLRAGLRALALDAPLRAAVVASVGATDERALAAALRDVAGANAEELAVAISRQAKDPLLRGKASAVLQALRAPRDH